MSKQKSISNNATNHSSLITNHFNNRFCTGTCSHVPLYPFRSHKFISTSLITNHQSLITNHPISYEKRKHQNHHQLHHHHPHRHRQHVLHTELQGIAPLPRMKAPTDKLSSHRLHRFAQIISMRTIALPRGKQAYPPYHSPFKRQANLSSPL